MLRLLCCDTIDVTAAHRCCHTDKSVSHQSWGNACTAKRHEAGASGRVWEALPACWVAVWGENRMECRMAVRAVGDGACVAC